VDDGRTKSHTATQIEKESSDIKFLKEVNKILDQRHEACGLSPKTIKETGATIAALGK
jgi:hypothetical protein